MVSRQTRQCYCIISNKVEGLKVKDTVSWKEHIHKKMQKEESSNAKKRRDYDSYASAKYCDKSVELKK